MEKQEQIKVWDSFVRFFHWSLVTAFFIAYLTEENLLPVHTWSGYLVMSLISIRLVWGFIGTRHARFSDFIYPPKYIVQFLKDTLRLRAERYLGHNPAGGAMVVLLLVVLFITSLSGILLLGAADQSGPVANLFAGGSSFWSEVLEEFHEFFANLTLLLVIIHVAGVVIESLIHNENLVSAMLSGFKYRKRDSR